MKITTYSHDETLTLGKRLGQCFEPGDIVLLFGDLGAGKTTLTQGLCLGLGLAEDDYIRSPTFTLVNEYQGTATIYHIDLYRLDSLREIEALGLEETLFTNGVSIIEWPEKLYQKSNLGQSAPAMGIEKRIEIHISIEEETQRTFQVELVNHGQRTLPL
jgi:tRNA threonylcarbamoyladenosine biosynthesis protein TsaE